MPDRISTLRLPWGRLTVAYWRHRSEHAPHRALDIRWHPRTR